MKNIVIVVAVLIVIGALGLGFAMNQNQNTASESTQPDATSQEQSAPTTATETSPAVEGETDTTSSEVRTIEIEGGSFYYKPNEIRVKQGEKVKIVMTSKDMMHDFVIDELNVKMPVVQSGNTGTVEFTADEKGSFEFYCSVGQHRQRGQVGTLIVE